MPESKTTVRIKSDAHPNGYIIVNAEDPRAQKRQEPEQDAPKRRRSTRRDG